MIYQSVWNAETGIVDVEQAPGQLQVLELSAVASEWRDLREKHDGTPQLRGVIRRMCREWAIEAGLVSGIYDINIPVSRTLVERGFEESAFIHGSTDQPVSYIITLLRDQKAALDSIWAHTEDNRQLTTSYIKNAHTLLLRHQGCPPAGDSPEQACRSATEPATEELTNELVIGEWKSRVVNPIRCGVKYGHCPPQHVDAEVARLIDIHREHCFSNLPVEIQVAWLHHRFTQISPFEDGNGRVARAVSSLILIREGLFPFTITRGNAVDYIAALEQADNGNLKPFVQLVADLQVGQLEKAKRGLSDMNTDDTRNDWPAEEDDNRGNSWNHDSSGGIGQAESYGNQGGSAPPRSPRQRGRMDGTGGNAASTLRRGSYGSKGQFASEMPPNGQTRERRHHRTAHWMPGQDAHQLSRYQDRQSPPQPSQYLQTHGEALGGGQGGQEDDRSVPSEPQASRPHAGSSADDFSSHSRSDDYREQGNGAPPQRHDFGANGADEDYERPPSEGETDLQAALDRLQEVAEIAESSGGSERRNSSSEDFDRVIDLSEKLANITEDRLAEEIYPVLQPALTKISQDAFVSIDRANEGNAHYYRVQIINNARRRFKYFANLKGYKTWVALKFATSADKRGLLIFPFHCIGKSFDGTLICAPFLEFRNKRDGSASHPTSIPITRQGFVFHHDEDEDELVTRFTDWQKKMLNIAISEITDDIGNSLP